MYTNTCSVRNKWAEVITQATQCNAVIVGLSETWLSSNDSIPSHVLHKYSVVRADRQDGRLGGGALLLLQHGMRFRESVIIVPDNIQLVSVILYSHRA